MISKEKIEEYKETLEDLTKDENVYNSIKRAVNGTFEYIQQLETKEQKVKERLEELKKEYKEALENNSTKAFILKCQIEILEEIVREET